MFVLLNFREMIQSPNTLRFQCFGVFFCVYSFVNKIKRSKFFWQELNISVNIFIENRKVENWQKQKLFEAKSECEPVRLALLAGLWLLFFFSCPVSIVIQFHNFRISIKIDRKTICEVAASDWRFGNSCFSLKTRKHVLPSTFHESNCKLTRK